MANNPSNECGEHNAGEEHALSPTQEKNHRQSDRVFLTLSICVSGVRRNGKDFLEEGQTIDISRQGATIKVGRDLFAGEINKIQRLDGVGKEAMARVVGRVTGGIGGLCVWGDDARPCCCKSLGSCISCRCQHGQGGAAGLAEMCCLRQNGSILPR